MTARSRPLLLAAAGAIVLFLALSKEIWVAVPIAIGVVVYLLSRSQRLGRGTTIAALGVVASLAFVAFGSIIALLSVAAKTMAGLVLASGATAITLGLAGLLLSLRSLRRDMRRAESRPADAHVPSP